MPNIKTFDSDIRAPIASQAGSEAFEIEGRHVEAAFAQAGNAIGGGIHAVGEEVQQHQEIQDTSNNSVQGAAAFANLSQKLQQSSAAAAADPANAQKHWQDFDQAMEDTIGQIGNDANTTHGKENAERIQNTLREEFTRQSMGAQSIVAGQQVRTNLEQTSNQIAQAVANNPTLMETGIALLHGSVEDQLKAHNLSPEKNAQIREEFTTPAIKNIGEAAFKTMAEQNPQGALDALSKGRFAGIFNGAEIGTLTSYANAQQKAQITAQRAQEEHQRQVDTDAFNQQTSAIVASMLRPDGTLSVPAGAPKAIIQAGLMRGAKPGEIKSLADMSQAIIKDQQKKLKATSDPSTYSSFAAKLASGNLSAQEVYDARTQGMLSDKDTSFYLRGIHTLAADPARKDAEKQFNAWAQAQKNAFTKPSGPLSVADPHGTEKFNQFYQDAHARFEQTYNSKGDWQSLLNAKNPNYLGQFARPYMQNVKGASAPVPRFNSDADVNAFLAKTPRGGVPFIGPDGKQYYTKGK